ncbi:hypothetical protein CsSME_00008746 [Camellia sinensis var. sinensis]
MSIVGGVSELVEINWFTVAWFLDQRGLLLKDQ